LKIFRYYKAEHALSVLRDLEIRASIPSELNDPFELSPNIDAAQFSQRRIEAILRQDFYVDKSYREEGRRRGLTSRTLRSFVSWVSVIIVKISRLFRSNRGCLGRKLSVQRWA